MATLTITRGISGSGKSTWARQQNAIVVSRDALREQYFPHESVEAYYKSPVLRDMEDSITAIQDATITSLLKSGKNVIADDTNIAMQYVNRLAKIGYRCGAAVEVKVFDVDFETAVARDNLRGHSGGRHVGMAVIKKQHERFKASKKHTLAPVQEVQPYFGTPGKPKAVLVDIDGTIAHMRDYRGPFEWKSVGKDEPDLNVMQVITWIRLGMEAERLSWMPQPRVILMSGRDESCRQETYDWTVSWDFNFDALFMRPEGDMRTDSIVKAELFDEHIRDNYDVVMVFDDRNQVVDMWRRMGIQVAQVAEGDF